MPIEIEKKCTKRQSWLADGEAEIREEIQNKRMNEGVLGHFYTVKSDSDQG